jgi:hypothetical protein
MMSRKVFVLALTMAAALALVGMGCGGDDSSTTCTGTMVQCGTACVNTETDHDNCGGCGNACPATSHCFSSRCSTTESCNNIDDDGDTMVDNGVTRACTSACGSGNETCTAGAWGACSAPAPATEVCYTRDNDCDTETDEGVGTTYYRDSDGDTYGDRTQTTTACGAPPTGYVNNDDDCNDGNAAIRPGNPELCAGAVDDDCDGTTNEDCPCSPISSTENCGEGGNTGECEWGTRTCQSTGWGACTGGVRPVAEICDGLDNDCDGTTDNGIAGDIYEANNACTSARALPTAEEAMGEVSVTDATLYSSDGSADVDWYTILAYEAMHLDCPIWPLLEPQCYFYFTVSLTPPAGADHAPWRMCVYGGSSCTDLGTEYCTTEADWDATEGAYVMAMEWEGTCGLDDSWTAYVKVDATATSAASCTPYTLDYSFDFSGGIGSTYCI